MPTPAAKPVRAAPTALPSPPLWAWLLGAVLMVAGAALAWQGGLAALGGVLAATVGAALVVRRVGSAETEVDPVVLGRHGAEVMVDQVVPVWSRHIETTRDDSSEGLTRILEAFSQMSGALGTLTEQFSSFAVSAEPGAVDGAIRRESPALDALTAASGRAFAERDAVVAELGRFADGLAELQHLGKQSRELARHTRLVAFNASIESNRSRTQGDQANNGSQAVASELRMVATRMADNAEQIQQAVAALASAVQKTRRSNEIGDTSGEELRLEIDLKAREALAALLGSLGSSLQSSAEVKQAANTLRDELDAAFVHFQFGDRISQQLSMVANDMSNFARWVAAHPDATQTDAAEWLAALEASYTMDEQRSVHHGNVRVDHDSGVDFF